MLTLIVDPNINQTTSDENKSVTEYSSQSIETPTISNRIKIWIILLVVSAFIIGVVVGFFLRPIIYNYVEDNATPTTPEQMETQGNQQEVNITETEKEISMDQDNTEDKFCDQYGTNSIPKNELLEEYVTVPGDTLRDIAKNKLDDETRALELIEANPTLDRYEVDDVLPMRLTISIPNDKYNEPNVTSYIQSKGNIAFNKDKPMFGVNAPNSGTGPFIISENIKDDLENIIDGDCVIVIYGSKGYDPQKIVFEVNKQE